MTLLAQSGSTTSVRERRARIPQAVVSHVGDWSTRSMSWIDDVRFRIRESMKLESNWDREGAEAVSIQAARRATETATVLHERGTISKPFVCATQEGGIAFEWLGDTFDVILTFTEDDETASVRHRVTGAFSEGRLAEIRPELLRAIESPRR